ncbi:MAG: 3-deoxy-8-phosphooctulonate synthase [Planctomycetes bacterium TMED75]|nr:3-deoxy-8-phosphooctulonate synthase [Planctomycetaceae bacterium]OUU92696.1 MAG: 3-deoxy-8-phosphooctulonate synthase [Planctomycetes bacterium TMED75]
MSSSDSSETSCELLNWFDHPGPDRPLLLIAGPCVLEDMETNLEIGRCLREACGDLGMPYVFKASFDKANRSNIDSPRGPGLNEGLEMLSEVGELIGAPTCTDVHLPEQAEQVGRHATLLQIPAFLCRQTDLLTAVAETGRPVSVKKGQFLAPEQMSNVIGKLHAAGGRRIMLTERGTFFGYERLVNDFIGLGDLMELGARHQAPVCFDVTHSTQLPGASSTQTGGRPDRAELLAKAAVAAGVDALFVECHPDPRKGRSDSATMLPLKEVPALLKRVVAIRRALKSG